MQHVDYMWVWYLNMICTIGQLLGFISLSALFSRMGKVAKVETEYRLIENVNLLDNEDSEEDEEEEQQPNEGFRGIFADTKIY